MTPQEFKAWFEGFTEAFDRVPTKAQWARVKERVAEIDGKPVTERVFVDRYWPILNQYPYRQAPYWQYLGIGVSNHSVAGSALGQAQSCNAQYQAGSNNIVNNTAFNSGAAMLELGRADAKALAA